MDLQSIDVIVIITLAMEDVFCINYILYSSKCEHERVMRIRNSYDFQEFSQSPKCLDEAMYKREISALIAFRKYFLSHLHLHTLI